MSYDSCNTCGYSGPMNPAPAAPKKKQSLPGPMGILAGVGLCCVGGTVCFPCGALAGLLPCALNEIAAAHECK